MLQIVELLNCIHSTLLKTIVPTIKAENLSLPEMFILRKVYRNGVYRSTDLAKDVDIPPSTFTGIVDRLVAKNYLKRVNDVEDRRIVLIEGTQELKELVEKVIVTCNMKFEEAFKDLPEELLQQLTKDLQELYQHLLQNVGADCKGGHCGKSELLN